MTDHDGSIDLHKFFARRGNKSAPYYPCIRMFPSEGAAGRLRRSRTCPQAMVYSSMCYAARRSGSRYVSGRDGDRRGASLRASPWWCLRCHYESHLSPGMRHTVSMCSSDRPCGLASGSATSGLRRPRSSRRPEGSSRRDLYLEPQNRCGHPDSQRRLRC